MRIIETDEFPFEFLSELAEQESWRKEIHRPVYHVHKWWAKRLGSIFRGMLLGAKLPEGSDFAADFYKVHGAAGETVFDPFMGSGTTVGEAHKLGLTALGRDINPVAVQAVKTALGPMDRDALVAAFEGLAAGVARRLQALYRSADSKGRACDVLYYFWVMQVPCTSCQTLVDLFTSWIVARNAYPNRKPEIQVVCPSCGNIFPSRNGRTRVKCGQCGLEFDPHHGPADGAKATCNHCHKTFTILDAVAALGSRPIFRLYGKLVLTAGGDKEYLSAGVADHEAYHECQMRLQEEIDNGAIVLPALELRDGHNTRQAIGYNFTAWRHFFNDRQLLALSWLRNAILQVEPESARAPLLTLFSGVLEFNNLFASYKGEGTGAVRHMFSHHILKPERTPIEANVWGTPKSSGAFSTLFRSRLLRAIEYRAVPTEVRTAGTGRQLCAAPFSGNVAEKWPVDGRYENRAIYLSCGDSADTGLRDSSVDLVITDPPFFDNVHYSELADFFYAWQQLAPGGITEARTTRNDREVQDGDPAQFAAKLKSVFKECQRVLKDDGLLVFTYHHSRDEGWKAVAEAVLGAGFVVVNSHPVKAEMSVATPKSQAKEPIQLDIILVCRKHGATPVAASPMSSVVAMKAARKKIDRLHAAGFRLSRNDQRIVLFGQLLATLRAEEEATCFTEADGVFEEVPFPTPAPTAQIELGF